VTENKMVNISFSHKGIFVASFIARSFLSLTDFIILLQLGSPHLTEKRLAN